MIKAFLTSVLALLLLSLAIPEDFLSSQKKYARVRNAMQEKQESLDEKLKKHKMRLKNLNILLVAYKDEDLLDVYAKGAKSQTYEKVFSYKICSRSGQLGPKRRKGDGQVPEGFYHIDRFNPSSNYHLSLGINYPNISDKRKSNAENLGGDIFIHGACVTIGCLPMEDNFIKEIYVLAVYARNNGQLKIPVYIFPFKMTDANLIKHVEKNDIPSDLSSFWDNLKIGHDQFAKSHQALKFQVAKNGDYVFQKK